MIKQLIAVQYLGLYAIRCLWRHRQNFLLTEIDYWLELLKTN